MKLTLLPPLDIFSGAGLPPRRTFITHGEPLASEALRQRIRRELRWDAEIPDYRDAVDLG